MGEYFRTQDEDLPQPFGWRWLSESASWDGGYIEKYVLHPQGCLGLAWLIPARFRFQSEMNFVKPLITDIEVSVYGDSREKHALLKNYADIDIQLTDLFDSRTFWDSKYGTNSSRLVVLASGLAPRVSNYHQESSIPTGLFQAACFESLKLQFPSSIIILTHTGPKIKLGDPIWHGPISQDERPFPNCPDICLNR